MYQTVLPLLLLPPIFVLWVKLAVPYTNRFFERLAQEHTRTWEKLGRPPYDRRWETPGTIIALPYLYKRRYRKFRDEELNRIGGVLIRVIIAGNVLSLLFFLSILNLMR